MKDLPHHMKKLTRKIIRSAHREDLTEEFSLSNPFLPEQKPSKQEIRKQKKQKMKAQTNAKIPVHLSADERNQKMKHRSPIFDKNNAKPKVCKSSKKKTPRI